jgi:hypothetical protein
MDGRVLTEIYKQNSELANRKIRYVKSKFTEKDGLYTNEKEKEAIMERLRDLGYLK